MTEKKYIIILNDFEHQLMVKALAEFRNQLLEAENLRKTSMTCS